MKPICSSIICSSAHQDDNNFIGSLILASEEILRSCSVTTLLCFHHGEQELYIATYTISSYPKVLKLTRSRIQTVLKYKKWWVHLALYIGRTLAAKKYILEPFENSCIHQWIRNKGFKHCQNSCHLLLTQAVLNSSSSNTCINITNILDMLFPENISLWKQTLVQEL